MFPLLVAVELMVETIKTMPQIRKIAAKRLLPYTQKLSDIIRGKMANQGAFWAKSNQCTTPN